MNYLRDLRKEKRLSQKDVALATGLTIATISRYETGKREMSIENAKKIANVLGIAWTALFDG